MRERERQKKTLPLSQLTQLTNLLTSYGFFSTFSLMYSLPKKKRNKEKNYPNEKKTAEKNSQTEK